MIVPIIIDYDGDEYAEPRHTNTLLLHYCRADGAYFDRYRHGEMIATPDQGYVGAYGVCMN